MFEKLRRLGYNPNREKRATATLLPYQMQHTLAQVTRRSGVLFWNKSLAQKGAQMILCEQIAYLDFSLDS